MSGLRQLFLQHLAQTTDFPLMLDVHRAKGVYLFGPGKKRYIDLISGIGVSSVGHLHRHVVKALRRQLKKHLHLMVYGELIQSPQVRMAKKLVETLPSPLESVYLVNSGSEAIEGALKLAKRATGRSKIVSCVNAYHGSSHGALSIGGNEYFKQGYRPLLPDVHLITHGKEEDLSEIDSRTAAVVLETVQGEAGVRTANSSYWKAIRQKCSETGALLILDEIQSGMGRTGKIWAFEHYGIQPDILVTAKGLGGGMPIGAFVASKHLMTHLANNPILGHITTFGGHPMSAAAALATLEILSGDTNESLVSEVEGKADFFIDQLQHPAIKAVRHKGLMMAFQFDSFDALKPIIDKAILGGVLTDWFLFCDDSMRIAPPLVISEKEIKKGSRIILRAIDEVMA